MSPVVAKLIRRLALATGGNYRAMKRAHSSTPRPKRTNFRKAAALFLNTGAMGVGGVNSA